MPEIQSRETRHQPMIAAMPIHTQKICKNHTERAKSVHGRVRLGSVRFASAECRRTGLIRFLHRLQAARRTPPMTRGKHLRRCHAAARSKSVDILARLCRRRRAVTDRRGKLTQLLAAAVPATNIPSPTESSSPTETYPASSRGRIPSNGAFCGICPTAMNSPCAGISRSRPSVYLTVTLSSACSPA